MTTSWRTAFAALVALSLLVGCGGSPAPAPAPAQADQQKAPTLNDLIGGALPRASDEPVDTFVYDRKGLRDAFQPFIRLVDKSKEKKRGEKVLVPKTPLQKFALEELKLVGIVWSDAERSKVLIEDPKGKGYYVGVGTWMGDRGGKIVRIHPDKIVVEEKIVDILGETNVKHITLTLHKAEDEVNP